MTNSLKNTDQLNESIISEANKIAQETIEHLIKNIDQLNFTITSEKTDLRLGKIIDQINSLIELFNLAQEYSQNRLFETLTLKESQTQMLFILKGIQTAKLKNNYLALEELIKFELRDTLLMWKVHFLTKMRKEIIQNMNSATT